MAQVTIEGIGPEEEPYLRELCEEYASAQFLDFQDVAAVQALAKGLRRYLERITIRPKTTKVQLNVG